MRELARDRFPYAARNVYTQAGDGPVIAHYAGHVMRHVDISAQIAANRDGLAASLLRSARQLATEAGDGAAVLHVGYPNDWTAVAVVWAATEDALAPLYAGEHLQNTAPIAVPPPLTREEELLARFHAAHERAAKAE